MVNINLLDYFLGGVPLFKLSLFLYFLSFLTLYSDYSPPRSYVEPPFVQRFFSEPTLDIVTPSLDRDRKGFTSQNEMMDYIHSIKTSNMVLENIGSSQYGLPILLVKIMNGGPNALTLLLHAQMHGTEPATGEAMLYLLTQIAKGEVQVGNINLLIIPRVNPDGSRAFKKFTAENRDINADFTSASLSETQALLKVFNTYNPHVVVDFHEYNATPIVHPSEDYSDTYPYFDILMLGPTNPNVHKDLKYIANRIFIENIHYSLNRLSLTSNFYYNSVDFSDDSRSFTLLMGSSDSNVARNYYALNSSVSLLIESRGGGIGWANFPRRVHSLVSAATAVIENANRYSDFIKKTIASTKQQVSTQRGDVILKSSPTRNRAPFKFIDAGTQNLISPNVYVRNTALQTPILTRNIPSQYVVQGDDFNLETAARRLGIKYIENSGNYLFSTSNERRNFIPLFFEPQIDSGNSSIKRSN